jgi:phosphoribosylformylglycinamidine cyclo-ligase
VPPLFRWLEQAGRVPPDEMRRTFNMGMGMILVVGQERADAALEELAARGGREARIIGEIVAGDTPGVSYR